MKILSFKRKEGKASLVPESLDDLWHASKLVEEGDLAGAKSSRKIKKGGADARQSVRRETSFFRVRVTKIDLDFASGVLRLAGEVVDGPEEVAKGSAQSLTIEKGTKLEITKERWKKHQIDRMNKAKRKLASAVLVCALDDGEVAFAGVSDSGVRELGELTLSLASKCSMRDCKSPKGQYEDLAKALRNFFDQLAPKGVVVASPGFWKDELFKVLKTKDSDLARTVRVESISTGGLAGVKELVKKGLDSESLAEEEAGLMEEIQKRIAKNGAVAYGLNDVKKSVAAVEKLAVSEKYVAKERKAGNYSAVEKLVDAVEKAGGTVILVGKSDAGKLLDGIGGIAALLHYKVK